MLGQGIYLDFIRSVLRVMPDDVRFTSWYRTPNFNRDVGGDPVSQHLLGLALDLRVDDPHRIRGRINDVGLHAIIESDHLHVQRFRAGQVAAVVRWLGLA